MARRKRGREEAARIINRSLSQLAQFLGRQELAEQRDEFRQQQARAERQQELEEAFQKQIEETAKQVEKSAKGYNDLVNDKELVEKARKIAALQRDRFLELITSNPEIGLSAEQFEALQAGESVPLGSPGGADVMTFMSSAVKALNESYTDMFNALPADLDASKRRALLQPLDELRSEYSSALSKIMPSFDRTTGDLVPKPPEIVSAVIAALPELRFPDIAPPSAPDSFFRFLKEENPGLLESEIALAIQADPGTRQVVSRATGATPEQVSQIAAISSETGASFQETLQNMRRGGQRGSETLRPEDQREEFLGVPRGTSSMEEFLASQDPQQGLPNLEQVFRLSGTDPERVSAALRGEVPEDPVERFLQRSDMLRLPGALPISSPLIPEGRRERQAGKVPTKKPPTQDATGFGRPEFTGQAQRDAALVDVPGAISRFVESLGGQPPPDVGATFGVRGDPSQFRRQAPQGEGLLDAFFRNLGKPLSAFENAPGPVQPQGPLPQMTVGPSGAEPTEPLGDLRDVFGTNQPQAAMLPGMLPRTPNQNLIREAIANQLLENSGLSGLEDFFNTPAFGGF